MPKNNQEKIRQLIRAYKISIGVDVNDTYWDKAFYGRHVRSASLLIDIFRGDEDAATKYLLEKGDEYTKAGLNWGLEGIIRAAGRDYIKIMEAIGNGSNIGQTE